MDILYELVCFILAMVIVILMIWGMLMLTIIPWALGLARLFELLVM